MKNLKTFENYDSMDQYNDAYKKYVEYSDPHSDALKKYGDRFSLSVLSKGDKVTYMGGEYVIDEANPYSIKLVKETGGKPILVNQKMFDDKGYISKRNIPQNYKG
jgi:hypothetical protein